MLVLRESVDFANVFRYRCSGLKLRSATRNTLAQANTEVFTRFSSERVSFQFPSEEHFESKEDK